MNVLLVEPYFGGSHRAWAEGYRNHSGHDVTLLTLPPRWWRWRMRGGAVTVAERAWELADDGYHPDVLLVSSMIDLGLLRSLLGPIWGRVPTALYLHETQLAYPDSPQLEPDLSYGFLNWTSVLAADRVFFNSAFHRRVFFQGLRHMLRSFPDLRHDHLVDAQERRSEVLPVGIELGWLGVRRPPVHPPLVLWNHRWEHDKDPESFFEALRHLVAEGIDFRLAVCGESFRRVPEEFLTAACELGDRIEWFGHAPLDRYRRILCQADVVVSTARQEFFGVSVLEAVAAGARPVLPGRLAYPELIPEPLHDEVLYEEGALEQALMSAVRAGPGIDPSLAEHARSFGWDRVVARYDAEMSALAERKSG